MSSTSVSRRGTRRGTLPNRSKLAATPTVTAASYPDAQPSGAYRFIEGVDPCLPLLSAADLAQLQDPFAVNVLQKGVGQPDLWPSSVELIVSLFSAIPEFAAN